MNSVEHTYSQTWKSLECTRRIKEDIKRGWSQVIKYWHKIWWKQWTSLCNIDSPHGIPKQSKYCSLLNKHASILHKSLRQNIWKKLPWIMLCTFDNQFTHRYKSMSDHNTIELYNLIFYCRDLKKYKNRANKVMDKWSNEILEKTMMKHASVRKEKFRLVCDTLTTLCSKDLRVSSAEL